MKNKFYYPEDEEKDNKVIYHEDGVDVSLRSMPYIIPASKSAKYSKLDKAKKREEKKLKKELDDYQKYDV